MDSHDLTTADYLELWKHFQNRSDELKASMFNTVAWLLGFATTLIGFGIDQLWTSGWAAIRQQPILALALCLAGLLLCCFAMLVAHDNGLHIKRNWDRANRCLIQFEELKNLVRGSTVAATQDDRPLPQLALRSTYSARPWVLCVIAAAVLGLFFLSGLISLAVDLIRR